MLKTRLLLYIFVFIITIIIIIFIVFVKTDQTPTRIRQVDLLWLGPNGRNTQDQQGCKAQQHDTESIDRHHLHTGLRQQGPEGKGYNSHSQTGNIGQPDKTLLLPPSRDQSRASNVT